MSGTRLSVLLFGPRAESIAGDDGSRFVRLSPAAAHALEEAGAAELNAPLEGCEAEFVAFCDAARCVSAKRLERTVSMMQEAGGDFAVLPRSQAELGNEVQPGNEAAGEPFDAWQRLPRTVAARLYSPCGGPVCIWRRAALEDCGGFADVGDPLRELLVRLVRQGRAGVVLPAETMPADAEVNQPRYPALAPPPPDSINRWLCGEIESVESEQLLSPIVSPPDLAALKAGLLQTHDFLDESHEFSQSVQGQGRNRAGDYWHAIMHRREPDYSNAKYWFRRVGAHPVYAELGRLAGEVLDGCRSPAAAAWKERLKAAGGWDAFAFVDLCRDCSSAADSDLRDAAERIQWIEMLLLLEQTVRDATES